MTEAHALQSPTPEVYLERRLGAIEDNVSRMADHIVELSKMLHSLEQRRHATIMVIDDSRSVLEATRHALEAWGFRVVTVEGAIGASAKMMEADPQVVLLDVTMPGLNGNQLVPMLRKNPKLQHTRFLLYSSKPATELEELARRCGADGFVCKTADALALVASVRQQLDG
jgi:DNA-binding response OmpR family regulator